MMVNRKWGAVGAEDDRYWFFGNRHLQLVAGQCRVFLRFIANLPHAMRHLRGAKVIDSQGLHRWLQFTIAQRRRADDGLRFAGRPWQSCPKHGACPRQLAPKSSANRKVLEDGLMQHAGAPRDERANTPAEPSSGDEPPDS